MAGRQSVDCSQCKICWSKTMGFVKKHQENVLLVLLVLFMAIGIGIGVGLRSLDPPLNSQQVGI